MALSDSMYLLKIVINNIKCYAHYKSLKLSGQFANLFNIPLKCPAVKTYSKKLRTYKVKKRNHLKEFKASLPKIKSNTGQSFLIISKSSELISLMKKYPLEIHVCKDNDLYQTFGSAYIPWNNEYIKYLNMDINSVLPSVYTTGEYNIYDELSSKRIASIDITLKLARISDTLTNNPDTFINTRKYEIVTNEYPMDVFARSSASELKENKLSISAEQITKKLTLHKSESSSDLDITKKQNKSVVSVMSCLSFDCKQKNALYQYIFGDPKGSFGNKVYQVGYFKVEANASGRSSPNTSPSTQNSENPKEGKNKLTFKRCNIECSKKDTSSCPDSVCTLDLPEEFANLSHEIKCKELTCNFKKHREIPPPHDDRILLDISNLKATCCSELKENVEEVVGGVIAKMKIGHDNCFCTCECSLFSTFTKKTTYCTVCGGYEVAGYDVINKATHEKPTPCPIFHKLVDKNKLKTWSTSGSESKKKGDDQKSIKGSQGQKGTADKRSVVSEKKIVESEKGNKIKKDERFQFNYGYKAPQIGHSRCALPCTGTLDNVPKRMGWLWSAENIPGMKFRPLWKPGAINKHVLRLLRIARHPDQAISKKKRKDTGKKKRPLKRPLLVVHKKDGEFIVTMETMKTYLKPRGLNQHPYEDKPVLTYAIGRTEEENRERLKRKERDQRRLERAQRHFIQSTFRDMCHEICLKTYQQALGILPNAEDPECMCYPALPSARDTDMALSCSCSEDKSSVVGSDTDFDEWFVEFTPPNATYDPIYKGKKVLKVDIGSQYSYLDYRVKLVDRFGNPIPRFFKGPDGKQQCSDLGGFWSPEHKWLEINVDGYIALDGKWAPMTFIGPSGEQLEAETGKFQATNGKWLVVGVDGFVDSQGNWKFYPKAKESIKKRYGAPTNKGKGRTDDKTVRKPGYKSDVWSCFGDASPKKLSELGIVGHGGDRKLLLMKLQKILAGGEYVRVPQPPTVDHLPTSKKARKKGKRMFSRSFQEGYKCHHPVPSEKGIIAVDDHGNKTYFKLRNYNNKRPKDRMASLTEQGISLSSFHVPCFHSFINSEVVKQQQRDRILALSKRNVATQLE
ncbi:uncharacterized protein LOC120624431 isoform X2 [Pararge aegeria]|uniref:uncharacterized protein LOC120624431 isoform X2 n=1 Tax=Pararge aegeria TaxID=116150 RepID=UPI0019D09A36|nr:uncharacterized protein LOC120624431 isoform X2 [Pararge aegeria]